MDYVTTSKEAMNVVGIAVRTANMKAMNDIPALWNRFYNEKISDKIPHKKNSDVCGLYIDYEADYTKPYTLVVGCEVSQCEKVPEGMVLKKVPSSKYAVFTAKGKFPTCLINTWMKIWQSNLPRAYTGDFELYKSNFNPQDPNAQVEIFIALKPE